MTHVIVTDLGYGDAGKGSVTDWLCSPRGVVLRGERPVAAVVRYNGGAQAGHNVTDGRGRWHTFSQFGSGTFRGVPTFLSRYMLTDPLALAAEDAHLAGLGYGSALGLLAVDRDALIITPYHIAANQRQERGRGMFRHGSCGKGIGETARFALAHPELAIRARDCTAPRDALWRRLELTREALLGSLRLPGDGIPATDDLIDAYRAFAGRVSLVDGEAHLGRLLKQGPAVFEGAQGVLLDERYGFHPYTTWSVTTSANAEALLAGHGEQGYWLGVTRAYMTRHGPGPLVTEDPALAFPELHNTTGEWQGAFRQGHPDLLALDYAVRANGGIDGLAVTHLDAVQGHPLKLCRKYRGLGTDSSWISLPGRDLAQRESLTRVLMRLSPVYDPGSPAACDLPGIFSDTARAPVVLRSYGPGARDKSAVRAARDHQERKVTA